MVVIVTKILFIDIETSPTVAGVWRMFKENISLDQIQEDWFIMSYSAKWYDDTEVMYNDCRNNIGNDRQLLEEIHTLFDFADIVIAHNVSFDIPKIKARMVLNNILPPSPFKTYCTLQAAKKVFGFTSNKLQYLSERLSDTPKLSHGKYPGYKLWKECLDGNMDAWNEMEEYNRVDVLALEDVYKKLRVWDDRHPNVAVHNDSDMMCCPVCNSSKLSKQGHRYTNTGKYPRYKCTDCGKWSRGRYTENSKTQRKILLV